MIVTIKTPQVGVYAQKSKWNALNQAINFEVQRKDQLVKFMWNSGGIARIACNGSFPSTIAVGQTIFVSFPSYSVTCKVTELTSLNVLSVDAIFPFSTPIYGGFINYISAFKNYHFISEVYGCISTGVHTYIGSLETKLNSLGVGKVSVQDWLKTRAKNINLFKYNVRNKMMLDEGTSFYLTFKESYNDSVLETKGGKDLFYWINSAKQIQEKFGRNVAEHVCTIDATRTEKAKFQSVFNKPTYFVGYPFSLNFIYSENLGNIQIKRMEEKYDINSNVVGTLDPSFLQSSQRFHANRLMLRQGYTSNIDHLLIWLESDELEPIGTVYSTGFSTGYEGVPLPKDRPKK